MKKVCVIEFPGVLSKTCETSSTIASLGGAAAIREATKPPYCKDGHLLNLTLRPGDLSSRSNIGSNPPVEVQNQFILHLKSNPEPEGGTSACPKISMRVELVARVVARISFPGISDFQYFDRKTLNSIRSTGFAPCSEHLSEWFQSQVPCGVIMLGDNQERASGQSLSKRWREMTDLEYITGIAARVFALNRDGEEENELEIVNEMRPARFARVPVELGSSDIWYKQFLRGMPDNGLATEKNEAPEEFLDEGISRRPARLVSEDKRMAVNRLESLPYRVDKAADKVPDAPTVTSDLNPRLIAVMRYLKGKFEQRPVWSRRKLLCDAPDIVRRDFKAAISRVAYSFANLSGPFHLLWIRYGYDPRVLVEARQYQVIEIRVKDIVSLEAMRQRWGERLVQRTGDDLDVPGNHSVSDLPCKRQLTLQLCDIDAPGLDNLLCTPENVQNSFDPLTGFLTKNGVTAVVDHVKRRIRLHASQELGEAGVRRILSLKRAGQRWTDRSGFGSDRADKNLKRKARPSRRRTDYQSSGENEPQPEQASVDAEGLAGASIDTVAQDVDDDLDGMRRAAETAAALEIEHSAESVEQGDESRSDKVVEGADGVDEDSSVAAPMDIDDPHLSDSRALLFENGGDDYDTLLNTVEDVEADFDGNENMEIRAALELDTIGDEDAGSVEGIEIYGEESEAGDEDGYETDDSADDDDEN